MTGLLLRGLAIGFVVAAPVGAIGVLCIQRTLARGARAGYATGLGVATADGLYAAVAAFGLTALTTALVGLQTPLRLVGGLALLYLGWKAFTTAPAVCAEDDRPSSPLTLYGSALALTLANPMTVMAFAAVFASGGLVLGGAERVGWAAPAVLVGGVFLGSLGWWLTLVTGTALVRHRASDRVLRNVSRASGLVIVAFAVVALASAVVHV